MMRTDAGKVSVATIVLLAVVTVLVIGIAPIADTAARLGLIDSYSAEEIQEALTTSKRATSASCVEGNRG